MKKRVLAGILTLCLALCGITAQAEPAAYALSEARLKALGGVFQAESGLWRIIAPETQAALDRLASGNLKQPTKAQVFFYVQLEADWHTSRIQPTLVVLVFGLKDAAAPAISIGLDDVRYDLVAAVQTQAIGSLTAQKLVVPLDAQGLDMLQALLSSETITLRLYGSTPCTFTLAWSDAVRQNATTQPDWSDMLRASLDGLSPMLERMNALDLFDYGLWDQNAVAWEDVQGFAPQTSVVTAGSGQDVMDMWLPGDRNDAITSLQKQLAAKNLYYGPLSGSYNALTQQAVTRLQQMEGLVPTGAADALVWQALAASPQIEPAQDIEADPSPRQGPDAKLGQAYWLGQQCTLNLSRYWFARSALPTHSSNTVLGVSVQNSDNVLLIVEGVMQNLGAQVLDLYWQMPVTLVYDDAYSFTCTLQRERDQGARFDTQLQPLEQSRVLICAELPQSVVSSDKPLRLEITLENETLQYTLR